MRIKSFSTYHLVKSEDLNHHGTLYAGRSAEWFVEGGFIAAADLVRPEHVVCLQIHGMVFKRPIKLGEVIAYESRIVLAGRTSLVANIRVKSHDEVIVDGFITFINVDMDGIAQPHGIVLEPSNDEEVALQLKAKDLSKKK
jgi:acyl-CoA hydrolase